MSSSFVLRVGVMLALLSTACTPQTAPNASSKQNKESSENTALSNNPSLQANPLEKEGQANPLEKEGQFTIELDIDTQLLPELADAPQTETGKLDATGSEFSIQAASQVLSQGRLESNRLEIPVLLFADLEPPFEFKLTLVNGTELTYPIQSSPKSEETLRITAENVSITQISTRTTQSENQQDSCTGENCKNQNADIQIGGDNQGDITINQGVQRIKTITQVKPDTPLPSPSASSLSTGPTQDIPPQEALVIASATPSPTPSPTPTPTVNLAEQITHTLYLRNIKDIAYVYINGELKYQAYYGKTGVNGNAQTIGEQAGNSGPIDISPHLNTGINTLLFKLKNEAACCQASLDIELYADETLIFSDGFSENINQAGFSYLREIGLRNDGTVFFP